MLLALLVLLPTATLSKEVEATNTWTQLGENDTIAAGMHVRIDMTTGEKFVKLPDDDDDDENAESKASASASNSVQAQQQVQVTPDGQVVDDDDKVNNSKQGEGKETYDFAMMHRTLSKLPDDEKERIGLPELPSSSEGSKSGGVASLSPDERKAFEARMKTIWEERQEQLRDFEVADLPQILKDRIQTLKEYFEDPVSHLKQLILEEEEDDSNKDDGLITTIIDVLKDLEYHLQDLDMTRDFYTLGGWPLLALLLSDHVHTTTTTNSAAAKTNRTAQHLKYDSAVLTDHIHKVQMHAAWTMGTAVKSTEEFTPYATSKIESSYSGGDALLQQSTTPLDLVLKQLEKQQQAIIDEEPQNSHSSNTIVVEKKIVKMVYCLGAFLRGNRQAQIHFGAVNGPELLSDLLTRAVADDVAFSRNLASKLLRLAADSVLDVTLHTAQDEEDSDMEAAIVEAWTSEVWCVSMLSALQTAGLEQVALETVHSVVPYCKTVWTNHAVLESLKTVRKAWESESEDDVDPEVHKERIALIDATVVLLEDS